MSVLLLTRDKKTKEILNDTDDYSETAAIETEQRVLGLPESMRPMAWAEFRRIHPRRETY
jgi:hypothetical protein